MKPLLLREIGVKKQNHIQLTTDNEKKLERGLAKLVLVVVELLRQLLERQAQRKVESGELSEEEIERLGAAFIKIKAAMKDVSSRFELEESELTSSFSNLLQFDEKSLSKTSIVDILDKIIEKRAVITGQISISVANIDLIILNLLASIDSSNNQKKELRYS